MPDLQTLTGGCHCGAVRYTLSSDLSRVVSCNCSICSKAGFILTFVPAEQFTLLSGEDQLTDYLFNKRVIHHLFCKVCGIHAFGRGTHGGHPVVAVNLRCVDGLDLSTLTPFAYDGKNA